METGHPIKHGGHYYGPLTMGDMIALTRRMDIPAGDRPFVTVVGFMRWAQGPGGLAPTFELLAEKNNSPKEASPATMLDVVAACLDVFLEPEPATDGEARSTEAAPPAPLSDAPAATGS